jgi:hypothetical protein
MDRRKSMISETPEAEQEEAAIKPHSAEEKWTATSSPQMALISLA